MQTSTVAPFRDNEKRRLATPADYALLEIDGDERFDSCLRRALHMGAAPLSRIGSIDRSLQEVPNARTDDSALPDTHRIDGILATADASLSERSAKKPLGREYPHVRTFNPVAF